MLKIRCVNQICATEFFFDEKKNPNASKVRCPKCKGIQPIKAEELSPQDEDDHDWLSNSSPKVISSPVLPDVQPSIKDRDSIVEKEDFFAQKKTNAVPQVKPSVVSGNQTGWLVIHDEQTKTHTFELRLGINRIGRKSNTAPKDINIAIPTIDGYMSRQHCIIEVTRPLKGPMHKYVLMDAGSSNGTFVNGEKVRTKAQEVRLKDGDTLQLGRTKLVLKLPATVSNSRDAERVVSSSDYFKTIIT